MPRYKLIIEFDGTNYSGWQIQPDAATVEQTLEDAFEQILQQKIDLIGQGRTDSGVHARGQVAHVDLPEDVIPEKLIFGVNGITDDDIYINKIEKVGDNFHARFDAISREYIYTITTRPVPLMARYSHAFRGKVDITKMRKCADLLIGEFDFAGFSKFNADNYTTLCEIQHASIMVEGEIIEFRIRANRFLRNMVRRLVGTMAKVGEEKMTLKEFEKILHNPSVKIPTFTAPAKGLILEKVLY